MSFYLKCEGLVQAFEASVSRSPGSNAGEGGGLRKVVAALPGPRDQIFIRLRLVAVFQSNVFECLFPNDPEAFLNRKAMKDALLERPLKFGVKRGFQGLR